MERTSTLHLQNFAICYRINVHANAKKKQIDSGNLRHLQYLVVWLKQSGDIECLSESSLSNALYS